jgi:hypothetical protein
MMVNIVTISHQISRMSTWVSIAIWELVMMMMMAKIVVLQMGVAVQVVIVVQRVGRRLVCC